MSVFPNDWAWSAQRGQVCQIIEAYLRDRYLPCYLLLAQHEIKAIHMVVAVDMPSDNIRVVTAYEPDPREWDPSFKIRRKSR